MNTEEAVSNPTPVPSIRYLKINRFRGVKKLEWRPAAGLNLIVGPGDSCKSTILEAVAALFSSAPNITVSEFDYYGRDVGEGFVIEAAVAVGDGAALKADRFPLPPLRCWRGGQLTDLPDEDGAEAVLVCRLTGTPDQEALYEVIGADEETKAPFPRALRQRIGLMQLGIADRWDRDLRLVQGGALDRYMEGRHLRQSILQAILNTPIHDQLGDEPKEALGRIETRFQGRSLPHPVRLGLVGTPGVSLAASVGLMVGASDESALPLPAWGTGTRRMASLELASILVETFSLAVVDEPESGLEPYRQRAFIGDLHQGGRRQAFITTHAPAVLSAGSAKSAVTWRVNVTTRTAMETSDSGQAEGIARDPAEQAHELVALEGTAIDSLLKTQPEALLARLPVICEGVTEEGFATRLFAEKFGEEFPVRGIYCVDAGGHDRALALCRNLLRAGFQLAAVVDDEGRKSGGWEEIEAQAALLRWENGAALEEAVLAALPDDTLKTAVGWPEEAGGQEERHCLADLRRAMRVTDKNKEASDLFEEHGRDEFLTALLTSACPRQAGNKKPKGWFKSFSGGALLAEKLLAAEPTPQQLMEKIENFQEKVEAATAT